MILILILIHRVRGISGYGVRTVATAWRDGTHEVKRVKHKIMKLVVGVDGCNPFYTVRDPKTNLP